MKRFYQSTRLLGYSGTLVCGGGGGGERGGEKDRKVKNMKTESKSHFAESQCVDRIRPFEDKDFVKRIVVTRKRIKGQNQQQD